MARLWRGRRTMRRIRDSEKPNIRRLQNGLRASTSVPLSTLLNSSFNLSRPTLTLSSSPPHKRFTNANSFGFARSKQERTLFASSSSSPSQLDKTESKQPQSLSSGRTPFSTEVLKTLTKSSIFLDFPRQRIREVHPMTLSCKPISDIS
ncbi:protein kinase superfamily protein [Striga asiatica]|uniref:Protein kinase superfamily protein n=1 Tax=Striga asiatica TaxID=4170 RepID=A0A5A7QHB7_STRAF|nr:protein kinase superfamily protein [Striga asiatica]